MKKIIGGSMSGKLQAEIKLRLKAPMIALEKIVQGRYLPKVFAEAALDELKKAQKFMLAEVKSEKEDSINGQ